MATAWTLAATDICTDALQHLSVIGDGETGSAGDMQLALRALDAVLKELPLSGYAWPKLVNDAALAWTSGQSIAAPADFYGYPALFRTDSGKKVQLVELTHAAWMAMPDRATASGVPDSFYVGPDKVIYLYPVPTIDPVLAISYQRIVNDASLAESPDLPQYWLNALGYGVANELLFKFDIPALKAQGINSRWNDKKALALESSVSNAPIFFGVVGG